MKTKRYHKDIFVPPNLQEKLNAFKKEIEKIPQFSLSLHAVKKDIPEDLEFYLNFIRLNPNIIDVLAFEFYIDKGIIKKVCIRFSVNSTTDYIVVLSSTGLIVTFYKNNRDDYHETLNKKMYEGGK